MFTTIDKALVGVVTTVVGVGGEAIAQQCGHALNIPVLVGAMALSLVAIYITPNKPKV